MEGDFQMELEKSNRKPASVGSFQDSFLSWMYRHKIGRMLLAPLISPFFSKIGGWFLGTRLSALFVKPFVRLAQIDLSDCPQKKFASFNDFFTRTLTPDARPVEMDPNLFISPCDARLTVYPITEEGYVTIKQTPYTAEALLKNAALARRYHGGTMWVFRLCVDDYHRYIYPVSGQKSANKKIPGIFHTVNPIANDYYPIYKENTREYCLIRTPAFGTVLMMEVGALLVGKIHNYHPAASVIRGQEKGRFEFGGSTIVLMTEKGNVTPDVRFLQNSAGGVETKVRLGEKIGTRG